MKAAWQVHHISHRSDVGGCRRAVVRAMEDHGLRGPVVHDGALVTTELATNLLKHAKRGRILTGPGWSPGSWTIVCLDQGPGRPEGLDVFADGYSTSGTIGSGLGTVRRLAQRFLLDGTERTRVFVQLGGETDSPLVFQQARSGSESGDGWCVQRSGGRFRVAMFDANGSGPVAHGCSMIATSTVLQVGAETSLEQGLRDVHLALTDAPRGVVGGLVDLRVGSVRWCGLGNVTARWEGTRTSRDLAFGRGLLGRDLSALKARIAVVDDGWVVLHTDGVQPAVDLSASPEQRFLDCIDGAAPRQDALAMVVPLSAVSRYGAASARDA